MGIRWNSKSLGRRGRNGLPGGVGDVVAEQILAGGFARRRPSSRRCGWRGHRCLHRRELLITSLAEKPLSYSRFTASTTRVAVAGRDAVMAVATAARSHHVTREWRNREELRSNGLQRGYLTVVRWGKRPPLPRRPDSGHYRSETWLNLLNGAISAMCQ